VREGRACPCREQDQDARRRPDLRKEVEAFYALANDLSKLDLARWSTLDDISLASDLAQREFRRMVDERDSGTMMFRF